MPYRTPHPSNERERDPVDSDLLVPFSVVWIVAVIHLGFAIARGETWGAGTTFTAILAAWIPWALRTTIRARLR